MRYFKKKENQRELLFLGAIFLYLFLWAVIQPYNVSPDEYMRYDIVEYLVKYGKLPHGGDPEIRNATWGISYAFNPILAYMFMAVFVRITMFFTDNFNTLLMAARIANVLLGTATAFFVLRISKRLFVTEARLLFVSLVCLLPGAVFLFSYVNSDGLALFSTAWIVYAWTRTLDEGWTWKNCVLLAAGISVCGLSYYNAYGFALCSMFFFAATSLMSREKRWDWKFFFSRGFAMAGIVFALIGWWFIRNYVIYDGDFLGQRTSNWYMEMYAIEPYKPSVRPTFQELKKTILDMYLYVAKNYPHNWILTVACSFVGEFGYMDIHMPYWLSKTYFALFGGGLLSAVLHWKRLLYFRTRIKIKTKTSLAGEQAAVRLLIFGQHWDRRGLFQISMAVAMVIPFALLTWYSYASDYQAQGRYLMPMLLPFMYFITRGYEYLAERFVKRETARRWIYRGGAALFAVFSLGTYLFVYLPVYIGWE
ncbi:MAG TPA: DUF2142 domain-containing protein [Candidatus Limivivens intestinipullorum]|uniref:DUF2142 domain-containing protein n=1 Tax=Candidatus Limivivens intestinipullorum TaxID=2840858 RepID=A0A9D1ETC3_9FIRM|nr:DUF2142 domain-containing protein [Candidatus Limivivens intestinipullorum]